MQTTATENQTIALAGMMQACRLVQHMAYHGEHGDQDAFEASIGSLFAFDVPDTVSVFGSIDGIRNGLSVLETVLSGSSRAPKDVELTRYLVTLFVISKDFRNDAQMANKLHSRLELLADSYNKHGVDSGLCADLNHLYRETISRLPRRFVINGEKHHLEDLQTSAAIRACLLAGIRATILFEQVGGRRWRLLFSRGKYLNAARALKHQHGNPSNDSENEQRPE